MKLSVIPKSILAISVANFLINIATNSVFALSTCYMKEVLRASSADIVSIQTYVDVLSYVLKVFSGFISDLIRRRKLIVLLGMSCIMFAKPMLALSTTVSMVFFVRVLDRFGNGIQASPRDALVGDLSTPEIRGRCFGFRHTLATLGSFIGAAVSYRLMHTYGNYRLIFFLGAVPCFIAILLFMFGTKDPLHQESKAIHFPFFRLEAWLRFFRYCSREVLFLTRPYWKLMAVNLVFMACRFSESVLIVNAMDNFQVSAAQSNIIGLCYNATMFAVTYPAGLLSDRLGRKPVLLGGIAAMMLCQGLLAWTSSYVWMLSAVLVWGIQRGITESMNATLISDYVPKENRGFAFSVYHLINALGMWVAGNQFHYFVNALGDSAGFVYGFFIGLASLLLGFMLLDGKIVTLDAVKR